MPTWIPCALALLTAIAAAPAAAAGPPVPAGILRVRDVRPGMEVTAYTVFAGTEIEAFHGRVLGVVPGLLGPARDVVLVEFPEERVRHTGIVHGMSGSPVFVGDRLLGALSHTLSPFPKDAVGGVTPIEYMLAEADGVPGGPVAAPPGTIPSSEGAAILPIATPLFVGGVPPEALAPFRNAFARLGLTPVAGGGGGDPVAPADPVALTPGAAVAAVLADGDLTLAATGTVTHRDGSRLYAFGHPFLQQGTVSLPMAPASIVTTLADQTFSYKIARVGPPAGTVTFDRTTGIAGEVGPVPAMIPLSVTIVRDGRPLAAYRYRLADNPWVTPLVAQLVVATSLALRWDYQEEATYRLTGTIRLAHGPALELHETYAVAPDPATSSAAAIATDLGGALMALWANPFAPPRVEGIELRYDVTERGLIERLEGVFIDPEKLRAGESARLRVVLSGLRGERRSLSLAVPIPPWAGGSRLALRVTDSATLRGEAAAAGSVFDRAADLGQLVELLAERPSSDRFHVQLLSFEPDAVLHHKRLPSLPGSVMDVLESGGGAYRRLPRALLWESTIESQGIALGTQEALLEVRP